MNRKYCVICFGTGVGEFKDLVHIASAPDTKIGFMNDVGVVLATFVSAFTKFELYNQFDNLNNITYVITEVDSETINFETEEMGDKLLGVFEGIEDEKPFFTFTPTSFTNINWESPEGFYSYGGVNEDPIIPDEENLIISDSVLKTISEKEKKLIIDNILMQDELSEIDKINLQKLSK